MGLIEGLYNGHPRDVALLAAEDVLTGKLKIRRTGQHTINPDYSQLIRVAASLLKVH